jgi:endoglucanase
MNRRRFLSALGAAPALAPALGLGTGLATGLTLSARRAAAMGLELSQAAGEVWQAWKTGYLQPDGRVIDRLQQNASHSEGQGYGMLLAAEFSDAEAFARMFAWTEANLALRPDPLLAWRWLPDAAIPVPDTNNASDGDLFYAWALVRAARRFANPRYLDRATDIALALAQTCVVPSPAGSGQVVFLPAVFGFAQQRRVVINPSYLMPRALREVAVATGAADLALAAQHGEALMARLAQDGLVPDWVEITPAGMALAEGFSPNTGYEAMRVPLFLIWSGQTDHPAVANMARIYDRTVQPGASVPTVIEPQSGVVLEASADPGYRAIAGLVSCAGRLGAAAPGQGGFGQAGAAIPPFDPTQPYYPATLHLFSMLAANEVRPECVPL